MFGCVKREKSSWNLSSRSFDLQISEYGNNRKNTSDSADMYAYCTTEYKDKQTNEWSRKVSLAIDNDGWKLIRTPIEDLFSHDTQWG